MGESGRARGHGEGTEGGAQAAKTNNARWSSGISGKEQAAKEVGTKTEPSMLCRVNAGRSETGGRQILRRVTMRRKGDSKCGAPRQCQPGQRGMAGCENRAPWRTQRSRWPASGNRVWDDSLSGILTSLCFLSQPLLVPPLHNSFVTDSIIQTHCTDTGVGEEMWRLNNLH